MQCANERCELVVVPREVAGGAPKKYCSNQCARYVASQWHLQRLTAKNRRDDTCIVCKASFTTTRSRVVTCSFFCARKHQQTRWRYQRQVAVIDKLGGACVSCGETDRRVLQVNHLNGGGGADRAKRGGNMAVLKHIMDTPLDGTIDLRCANCNILYEYERGRRYDITSDKSTVLTE